MNAVLNHARIAIKLPLIIVLLSLLAIVATGYIAGITAARTLRE